MVGSKGLPLSDLLIFSLLIMAGSYSEQAGNSTPPWLLPLLLLEFLLQIPLVISYDLKVSPINPLLSKLLVAMVFLPVAENKLGWFLLCLLCFLCSFCALMMGTIFCGTDLMFSNCFNFYFT
ncbi:hypothetical protein LEMLEM_LOCUS2680 [Lemmus lemmus]